MKQDQKKVVSDLEATDEMAGLKDEFKKLKETPTTRPVILIYKSCCGCGCDDMKVKRTVPYDSPLKDGDRIEKVERGDRSVD